MIRKTMAPGVYVEHEFERADGGSHTAVPLFLGYVEIKPGRPETNPLPGVRRLTQASQLDQFFRSSPDSYLGLAVTGFFANGGQLCYVASMEVNRSEPPITLRARLTALAALQEIDLVCAPDIMTHLLNKDSAEPNGSDSETVFAMQRELLEHCDRLGDRFAILDSIDISDSVPTKSGVRSTLNQTQIRQQAREAVIRQRDALYGINGALYFPWLQVGMPGSSAGRCAPPCGYVAGIYARTDKRSGVHKAPANEALEGVIDLQYNLDPSEQGSLNAAGVNCLRAFPGRGIRVWGARTLSRDPTWTYVNVRRLLITAGRWIERNLASLVFEPNDARLWERIRRELTTYLNGLYQQGALKGNSAEEAFYVKCDEEINPAEERAAGRIITEIGLAPAQPGEFIVVHLVHGASGVAISGPVQPM